MINLAAFSRYFVSNLWLTKGVFNEDQANAETATFFPNALCLRSICIEPLTFCNRENDI